MPVIGVKGARVGACGCVMVLGGCWGVPVGVLVPVVPVVSVWVCGCSLGASGACGCSLVALWVSVVSVWVCGCVGAVWVWS
jgi:hypothetical protein